MPISYFNAFLLLLNFYEMQQKAGKIALQKYF